MPGAYGGQKPTLNPTGLELQVVVSKPLQESCIDLSQMEREVDIPHPIPNLEAIGNNIYICCWFCFYEQYRLLTAEQSL